MDLRGLLIGSLCTALVSAVTPVQAESPTPAGSPTSSGPPVPSTPRIAVRVLPRSQLVANLITVASREWLEWGRSTVDVRDGGTRIERVGARETDTLWLDPRPGARGFDAASRVRRYWVEGLGPQGSPSRSDIDIDTAARTQPWSAVFISYLMRSVGVDRAAFVPTDRHADYLRAASESPQFDLLRVQDSPLAPGDLICAPRNASAEAGWLRLQSLVELEDLSRLRAAHCDLVVSVDRGQREGRLIGGNVEDSVAMTRISLTGEGRAIRTIDRPFFVLVRPR